VTVKLTESPGRIETAGPLLGQHNEEVYSHLLGYTKDDLARLREEGVV